MSAAQEEFNELMRSKEQRTAHPEDDEDQRASPNLSDDEESRLSPPRYDFDPDTGAPLPNVSRAHNTIPLRRFGANTGPKGVISDAQDFRDPRRVQRNSIRSSNNLASPTQYLSLKEREPAKSLEEEDEDLNDEDEDDFLDQWRQSRLKELQSDIRTSRLHINGRSRKTYGGLTTVDGEGYLNAVDNSGQDTIVVVFIFDDLSQVSDLLEDCIRTLAGKHQHTRFVKLHYEEAEMDPVGVPAVIGYRNGEKFAALVPLIDELPDDADLTALTLEAVFKRHQILI